jgi:hypothetical protein
MSKNLEVKNQKTKDLEVSKSGSSHCVRRDHDRAIEVVVARLDVTPACEWLCPKKHPE